MDSDNSMKLGNSTQNVIRFVSLPAPALNFYAIDNPYGNVIHVYEAVLIRIFAERFRARYQVLTPPDGGYGSKLPNGTWSGMVGMVERSEVDLAMASTVLTEDRLAYIQFSYSHLQNQLTFMTDKPIPLPKSLVIVYPFSGEVWVFLAVCLMTVSFIFYTLMHRKRKYDILMLRVFGSLMEQDIKFLTDGYKLRLLAMSWFFGVMIITYGYKATLLSFLTFPTLSGIRNISDLSKAISANSVTCFTYRGSYMPKKFLDSEDHSWRALGQCLLDNEKLFGAPEKYFLRFPTKKVFIGDSLGSYDRAVFVSKDSFYNHIFGIPVSKGFCCVKYLNDLIHRLNAAGLIRKYSNDKQFILKLHTPHTDSSKSETVSKIQLKDISGAFCVVIAGWILALVSLLMEVVVKRCTVH